MSNAFDDIRMAVNRARELQRAVDNEVGSMAYLCRNRLRAAGVSRQTLATLKRELRDYNIHTGRWKDE